MFGSKRAFSLIRSGRLFEFEWDPLVVHRFGFKQISRLANTGGKHAFLVDTLALVIHPIFEFVAKKFRSVCFSFVNYSCFLFFILSKHIYTLTINQMDYFHIKIMISVVFSVSFSYILKS